MEKESKVLKTVLNKTNNGKSIPLEFYNNIGVSRLTIFEEICIKNRKNLDGIALEINGNKMTYKDFIFEVEKYMRSFQSLGVKSGDVVSLCLPVSIEFICSYFALTTMGAVCNALNIGFLLTYGIKSYLDDRLSEYFMCYDGYYKLLKTMNKFEDSKLGKLILTSDCTYAHYKNDDNKILVPDFGIKGIEIITLDDFFMNDGKIEIASFDPSRPSTFTYTSGTTGMSKCMAHSDLAPLFMIASHEQIKRPNENIGDRSLITIPFAHPTGLFYSMVLQLAEGKTLVLEPRYDKRLFHSDLRDLKINHAVQAKPFYAQLIQDRANGLIKPGDFSMFKSPYSGGEGIPSRVCEDINDTLNFAGCNNSLTVGYGRSEEGSICLGAYGINDRNNTVGLSIPGVQAKLIDLKTGSILPYEKGSRGEIILCSPVGPLNNCYIGKENKFLKPDGSFISDGQCWSRPGDIATIVDCGGTLSYLVLGRKNDKVVINGEDVYLFDLKEQISNISGILECEVISLDNEEMRITVHCVIDQNKNKDDIINSIKQVSSYIDAIKLYDTFPINLTSGKCDRNAMSQDTSGYIKTTHGKVKKITK